MLGFEALGRNVPGQISGTKTVDLVAAAASFALTGEPVTFKATEVVASGSFTLTGETAAFAVSMLAAQGAYTVTGNAGILRGGLTAAQGAFALTGFAITEGEFEGAGAGLYTFTGFPALYSIDFNKDSAGSSISGGTFSRKRWRDMLDAEERRHAAAARRIADEKLRRRARECGRQQAEAEHRRATRAASKAEGEARAGALALAHHQAAVRGMDRLCAIANAAGAQAAIGRSAPSIGDDDEDVIALIMAMHQ